MGTPKYLGMYLGSLCGPDAGPEPQQQGLHLDSITYLLMVWTGSGLFRPGKSTEASCFRTSFEILDHDKLGPPLLSSSISHWKSCIWLYAALG